MLQQIDSNTESNLANSQTHFQNSGVLPLLAENGSSDSSHHPLNTIDNNNVNNNSDNTTTTQPNLLPTHQQFGSDNTLQHQNLSTGVLSQPEKIPNYISNDSTTFQSTDPSSQTTFQPTITTSPPLTTQILPNSNTQPIVTTTATTTSPLQQNFPATMRTQNTTGYITPPFLSNSQGFQQPNYPTYTQSSYIQNYQTNFPTPQPGGYPQSTYSSTFPTTTQSYPSTANSSAQHTNYNYHNYTSQTGYNMAHPGVINYANYSGAYSSSSLSSIPNTYQSEYKSQIVNDGTDKNESKETLISPDSIIKVTDNTEHVIHKRDRDRRQEKDWNPNLKKRRAEGKKKVEEPVEEPLPEEDYEVEVVWSDSSLIKKEEGDESLGNRYDSVVANGKTYKVGDTIAVWPEGGSRKPAPMGTIKSLYTDGENNNMELCWFYRIEETVHKNNRRQKVSPREVFLSSHTDENPVESIAKVVTIKPEWEIAELDEYITQPDCYYYKKKYDHLEKVFIDL